MKNYDKFILSFFVVLSSAFTVSPIGARADTASRVLRDPVMEIVAEIELEEDFMCKDENGEQINPSGNSCSACSSYKECFHCCYNFFDSDTAERKNCTLSCVL